MSITQRAKSLFMSRIAWVRIKQTPLCYTVSVRNTINFIE